MGDALKAPKRGFNIDISRHNSGCRSDLVLVDFIAFSETIGALYAGRHLPGPFITEAGSGCPCNSLLFFFPDTSLQPYDWLTPWMEPVRELVLHTVDRPGLYHAGALLTFLLLAFARSLSFSSPLTQIKAQFVDLWAR